MDINPVRVNPGKVKTIYFSVVSIFLPFYLPPGSRATAPGFQGHCSLASPPEQRLRTRGLRPSSRGSGPRKDTRIWGASHTVHGVPPLAPGLQVQENGVPGARPSRRDHHENGRGGQGGQKTSRGLTSLSEREMPRCPFRSVPCLGDEKRVLLFLAPTSPSPFIFFSLCRIIENKKARQKGSWDAVVLALLLFIFLSCCSGSPELTERFCRIETL